LVKSSFSLLETLLSLIILLVIISEFSNILSIDENYEVYKELEMAHNEFILKGSITTPLQYINLQ
jgi:hypothetical protein